MGCCVRTQGKVIIKSLNIPLSDQESSLNENEKNFQQNPNGNIIIPKQKITSDKSFDLVIQKEKNKIEKKNLKSMNALREISYNEVCDCAKFF